MYFQGTKMELVNQHKPQPEVLLYHMNLLKKKRGRF